MTTLDKDLDLNFHTVSSVLRVMNMGSTGVTNLPANVALLLKTEAWRKFRAPMAGVQENKTLEEFLASPVPKGLASTADDLRRMVALAPDSDEKRFAMDKLLIERPERGVVGRGRHNNRADNIRSNFGTSESAVAERLRRKRPDLYERVRAGEIKANAAAIEAGWRTKTITVPIDAHRAADTLFRHFEFNDLELLVKELQERLAR